MATGKFSKIRFGAGFTVTDEGRNVIRVEGGGTSGTAGGDLTGSYPNPTIAPGAVDSSKIADGSITNTDIAAAAAIDPVKLSHPGGTTQFLRADGTWATPSSTGGGASPTDTATWLPLTTTVGGDDVLVFDDDHSLVPTLIPF